MVWTRVAMNSLTEFTLHDRVVAASRVVAATTLLVGNDVDSWVVLDVEVDGFGLWDVYDDTRACPR